MDYFLDTTTFHCFVYLKTNNKKVKAAWLLLLSIALCGILLSTIAIVTSFIKYTTFLTTNEIKLDRLESIPNLLLCSKDTLNIAQFISESNPVYEQIYGRYRQHIQSKTDFLDDYINFNKNFFSNLNGTYTTKNHIFDTNYMHNLIKNYTIAKLSRCQLKNSEITVDCDYLVQNAFTPSGVCIMVDLANSDPRIWSSPVKMFLELDYDFQESIYLSFTNNKLIMPDNNSVIYFPSSSIIISSYQDIKMKVVSFEERYSEELNDKKCIKNDVIELKHFNSQEQNCNFDCLHLLIRNLLKCNFIKVIDVALDVCTLNDLIAIESIFNHYEQLIDIKGLCQNCLKDCEAVYYDTSIQSYDQTLFYTELTFSFNFKRIITTHNIEMPVSQFLNNINGFWSLFLGISVLSLWEIIELIWYYVSPKKKISKLKLFLKIKCKCKLLQQLYKYFSLYASKTYNILQHVFEQTVIHGIKSIVDDKITKFSRIRWSLVVCLVCVGFAIIVVQTVSYYNYYYTDLVFKDDESFDENTLSRNLSIRICIDLNKLFQDEWSYKGINLKSLFREVSFLWNQNYTLKKALEVYKTKRKSDKDFVSIMLEKSSFNESILTYGSFFSLSNMSFLDSFDNDEHPILFYKFYLFDVCYDTPERMIKQIINNQPYKQILHSIKNTPHEHKDYVLHIFDSNYFYSTDESSIEAPIFDGMISLKFQLVNTKYIGEPYKPSCYHQTKNKMYKQQHCLNMCLNNIIKNMFGCKLLYSNSESLYEDQYCHPLLALLIQQIISSNQYSQCNHCLIPCNSFHYSIKSFQIQVGGIKSFNFKFLKSGLTVEQIPLITFENMLLLILSYFGLLFGGSLLSSIECLHNITLITIQRITKCRKIDINIKLPVLNFLSKITTCHSVRFLSSENGLNISNLFWLLIIMSTVILNIIYSMNLIKVYNSGSTTQRLHEIDDDDTLNISFCSSERLSSKNLYSFLNQSNLFQKILNSSLQNNVSCKSQERNCSLEDYVRSAFDFYDHSTKHITELTQHSLLNNINWIEVAKKFYNYGKVFIYISSTNSTITLDLNQIHSNNIAFQVDAYGLNVENCQLLNLKQWINNASYSFLLQSNNRFEVYSDNTEIYLVFEGMVFQGKNKFSSKTYAIKKSLKRQRDSNLKKCYYFDERQHDDVTFHCNNKFKNLFQETFNCTLFRNNSNYDRCSVLLLPFITDLFGTVGTKFGICESCEKIQQTVTYDLFEDMMDPLATFYFTNFKKNAISYVPDVDLYKLVIDTANLLNVTVGVSILTLFELFYLIILGYCDYLKKKRIVEPTVHNN